MTYVIGKECIDVQDKSCIDVCPVDCIYEGGRKTYINPNECIDCGACELACPEVAIFPARKARGNPEWEMFTADQAAFFTQVLPGRDGLLHISEIANYRIADINDVLKVGQSVRVKILEADDRGRLRLSVKAIGGIEAQGGPAAPSAAE